MKKKVVEIQYIQAAQERYMKTLEAKYKALADEQRWVRELEPSRGTGVQQSYQMEITAYTIAKTN